MPDTGLDLPSSKLRHPPQVTLAIDDDTRVLSINRSLTGTAFATLCDASDTPLHTQLHPGCDGECRFNALWKKARASLQQRDSIEWEVEDDVLDARFRCNLHRPPTSKNVKVERRRRRALLTIVDITQLRREYQELVHRNRELSRMAPPDDGDTAPQGDRGSDDESDERSTTIGHHIISAQESERKRIAADLHDGVAQSLGAIKFGIEAHLARLEMEHPDLDLSGFADAVEQIKDAVEEVRNISRNLAPSMLDDFGICVALEWLCKDLGPRAPEVELSCQCGTDASTISEAVRVAIYRLVQEAINNTCKYAAARHMSISLCIGEDLVSLVVSDDGKGFEPGDKRPSGSGLGLRSMRERVEATGGRFTIHSVVGEGTKISASWLRRDA